MKKLISLRLAGNILLMAFGSLAIFHLLVLFNVISPDIVWGGQAGNTDVSIYSLEIVALFMTTVMGIIVAAKIGYIQAEKFKKVVNIGVWMMFIYLLLNTLGNLASANSVETYIFTPLSIIMALCALRLVFIEKKKSEIA